GRNLKAISLKIQGLRKVFQLASRHPPSEPRREDTMPKRLSICAALCALMSGPVVAQQQEAVLKRLELPEAAFDLVVVLPKSPPRPFYDLSESPDALVVHVIGGKLVLTFDDALEMIKAAE